MHEWILKNIWKLRFYVFIWKVHLWNQIMNIFSCWFHITISCVFHPEIRLYMYILHTYTYIHVVCIWFILFHAINRKLLENEEYASFSFMQLIRKYIYIIIKQQWMFFTHTLYMYMYMHIYTGYVHVHL